MYEQIRFVRKINDQQQLDKDKLKCLIILQRCWFSAVSFERLSYTFSQCSLFGSMATPRYVSPPSPHYYFIAMHIYTLGTQCPGASVASSGFMSQNEMKRTCIVCGSRERLHFVLLHGSLDFYEFFPDVARDLQLAVIQTLIHCNHWPVICCLRGIEHD